MNVTSGGPAGPSGMASALAPALDRRRALREGEGQELAKAPAERQRARVAQCAPARTGVVGVDDVGEVALPREHRCERRGDLGAMAGERRVARELLDLGEDAPVLHADPVDEMA